MNKKKNLKKQHEDLARAKAVLSTNLKVLEEKLTRFRSSSPEKWVAKIGEDSVGAVTDHLNLGSARSSSEQSSSSVKTEENIKTIAENENFIKQKIGGIEDELSVLSSKIMPDGLLSLQEDLQNMEDGLNGLQEVVESWDKQTKTPPKDVQIGITALQNALKELSDDAEIIIQNESLSDNFQLVIEESLHDFQNINNKLTTADFNLNVLDDFEKLKDQFKNIRDILDKIKDQSLSLNELHTGIDKIKEDFKSRIREVVNYPNKVNENPSTPLDFFENLEDNDFIKLDTIIGYEITDFILRNEEEEIASLRNIYADSQTELSLTRKKEKTIKKEKR